MTYLDKLKRNIWLNHAFVFIKGVDFTQGIWLIYLAYKGLSLVEIGFVESIFHVTAFIMEVPTGIVADLYGRKTSRICGRVLFFVSVIMFLYAEDFWGFAFAFMATAVGYNLESGAGEALLYDSLKALSRTDEFMKHNGRVEIAMQLAGLVALPAGGYLATRSYAYAIGLTLITAGVSVGLAFFFEEPLTIQDRQHPSGMLASMKNQVHESFDLFKRIPMTGYLIIVMQLFSLLYTTSWFYIQNYYKGIGLNEFHIGLVLAIAATFGAFFAAVTHRIEARVKPYGMLSGIPVLAVACYWGIALNPSFFGFFVLLAGIEGMYYVALSDYLNRFIPSEQRATVLSFGAMCFSAMMIVMFPLFGYLGDVLGLKVAFVVMAVTATVVLLSASALLLVKGKAVTQIQKQQKDFTA